MKAPGTIEVDPMATPSTLAPIILDKGAGERRWFYGGGVHTWKATSEETGGAFFLFEDELEEGKLTPLHRHPDADETIYVLEGEILTHIDGRERRIGAGGMTFTPRGTPHAFRVLSVVARLLCFQTPGSSEAFYRGASECISADGAVAGAVDFARVRASATETGATEILGPPPFAG
jgi:quercetin dioxygenase-like cupin family protein